MSSRACLAICTALALCACKQDEHAGTHESNVTFAASIITQCPTILGIEALPLEVMVGSEVQLSAKLRDASAKIVWHADGGVFSSRTSATTSFRCDLPGAQTVVFSTLRPCRQRATIRVTCTVSTTCGDGHVDFGEQCDDGGTLEGDGCSEWCIVEPDFHGGQAGAGK
jgi:cysteine-rich repeat protein